MINKLHFLNEDTVIRAIARDEITEFRQIPKELVTPKVIRHWIMCGSMEGVPLDLMDDAARELAVSGNPENLKYFNVQNCPNYQAVLATAMGSYFFDFSYADMNQVTPAAIASASRKNGDLVSSFFSKKEWASEKERLTFIDELVIQCPLLMFSSVIRLDDISDEAIAQGLSHITDLDFYSGRLIKAGRENVFSIMAGYDRWLGVNKPNDLMGAVWRIMRVERKSAEFKLLCAFVRQYPIGEVCVLMGRGQARQKLLAEIFPSSELIPHVESLQHTKRHMLSRDMEI
jgi:hypothetical protein